MSLTETTPSRSRFGYGGSERAMLSWRLEDAVELTRLGGVPREEARVVEPLRESGCHLKISLRLTATFKQRNNAPGASQL